MNPTLKQLAHLPAALQAAEDLQTAVFRALLRSASGGDLKNIPPHLAGLEHYAAALDDALKPLRPPTQP